MEEKQSPPDGLSRISSQIKAQHERHEVPQENLAANQRLAKRDQASAMELPQVAIRRLLSSCAAAEMSKGSGWSQEATATTLELEAKAQLSRLVALRCSLSLSLQVPVPEPIPEPPAAIQPSLSDAKQQVEAEAGQLLALSSC